MPLSCLLLPDARSNCAKLKRTFPKRCRKSFASACVGVVTPVRTRGGRRRVRREDEHEVVDDCQKKHTGVQLDAIVKDEGERGREARALSSLPRTFATLAVQPLSCMLFA
jgi:hypothetical protein